MSLSFWRRMKVPTSLVDVAIYFNTAITLKSRPNWKTKKKMQTFSLCAKKMQGVLLA